MKNANQTKNLWWGVSVIVVILILGLWALRPAGDSADLSDIPNTTTPEVKTTPVKVTTAPSSAKTIPTPVMTNLFPNKGNYQCDYEELTPSYRASNTIYLADGKMRGEFRTISSLKTVASIMVYDGTYLYVWTEGQAVGTRSQPKSEAELPAIIPRDIVSGKVLGSSSNNVSWNCHPWSKNSSMLAKPGYVTFN